jgi:HlyD family type I secretion membrane fusion protein
MANEIAAKPGSQVPVMNDRFDRNTLEDWSDSVDTDTKKTLRLAHIIFLIIFGFGGVWSCTAPLGGAIVLQGRVVAEGKNRVIQHLEGGILKELYVQEGDRVEAGQIVAKLDTTQINAQLRSNMLQKAIARISLSRYRAEAAELETLQLPTDLNPNIAEHPTVQEAMRNQEEEFYAQLNFRKAGDEIADSKIAAQRRDIQGLSEVLKAMTRQLELYNVELEDYRELLTKGAIDRTRVFATERQVVDHQARIARTRLDIQQAENNIETLENEKRQTRLKFLKDAASKIVETQREIARLDSTLERLNDVSQRSEIVSNDTGTVFRIAKQTIGGVLGRGEVLMEIYPDEAELTVEGRMEVRHIEKVSVGQEAAIVFPTNRAKSTIQFPAVLTFVSPDSVTSDRDPVGKYIVRVTAERPEEVMELIPGNSAQIFIKTEAQTFVDVLAGPIQKFGSEAFTE